MEKRSSVAAELIGLVGSLVLAYVMDPDLKRVVNDFYAKWFGKKSAPTPREKEHHVYGVAREAEAILREEGAK